MRVITYLFLFSTSFLFLISLASAQVTYDNCNLYGNCKPVSTTSAITFNNATGLVNDSVYWQGYTPQTYNQTFVSVIYDWVNSIVYPESKNKYNETYNNLLNSHCPNGYIVNGTLSNGTFICTLQTQVDWTNVMFQNDSNNLNVNSSSYWNNFNSTNSTQISNNNGIFNIIPTWIVNLVYTSESNNSVYWQGYTPQTYNQTFVSVIYDWAVTNILPYAYNQTIMRNIFNQDLNVTSNVSASWFKGLFNWTVVGNWFSWNGATLIFNDTQLNDTIDQKLTTIFYTAESLTVVTGTGSGNLFDIQTYNNTGYNITEQALAPAMDFRVNFTGVTSFNEIIFRTRDINPKGKLTIVSIWDYNENIWESYAVLSDLIDYETKAIGVYDSTDHLDGGIVQVRFLQGATGNTNTVHLFDWVTLAQGASIPSGAEVDPYSIHKNITNLTQFEVNSFFNINTTWLTDLGDSLWCKLTGCSMAGNINMSYNNITEPSYIIMKEISGSCDLTINHSICYNQTGGYFIG